jgi:rare lipoprotein A
MYRARRAELENTVMSAAPLAAKSKRGWAAEAALLTLAGLSLAACASMPAPVAGTEGQPSQRYAGYKVGQPYQVRGVWYTPKEQPNYDEIGIASWYGEQFHNHYTADGEVFDMTLPSAAHTTLPLPSLVEVTNLTNGKTLVVRVNDRGPFIDGRIIDLSKEAAAELGFVTAGVTQVRVRYVGRASDPGGMSARQELASAPAAPKAFKASAPKPPVDFDYVSAPKRPIPYGQLVHAQAAPAVRAPATDDVDTLLGIGPAAAPGPASAAAPATYELMAGTFATEDAARRFASRLTGGGLPEVQVVHDGLGVTYQVVLHGLAGPTEAAAARSEAVALGATRALIVGGS